MSHPQIHTPRTFYNYDNGLPSLVGILDARKMDEPLDRFAADTLFMPLGIGNYRWTPLREGGVLTAGGLALLPRDMVKIGQLMYRRVAGKADRWFPLPGSGNQPARRRPTASTRTASTGT